MLLLVLLYRRNAASQNILHKIPYILFGLLFVGKVTFELSTAQSVFVHSSDLFVPVPLAHLGGAFVGGIIGTCIQKDINNSQDFTQHPGNKTGSVYF